MDLVKEDFKRFLTDIYETEIPEERRNAKESNPTDYVAQFIAARVVTNPTFISWLWEWSREYEDTLVV